MSYRQDESYSLNAHVSSTVREILGRRLSAANAWSVICGLWTSAILDSREPSIMRRDPRSLPRPLVAGWFLDPWSDNARERMVRTYPELVEAFRSTRR